MLLDDNAAERAQVRAALPLVAVPELPMIRLYTRHTGAAGYFEAVAFSDEDRRRADFYRGNAREPELKAQASDLGDYLPSLDMVISHTAVRCRKPATHRATDQQVQPIQPDDAPLHRGRSRCNRIGSGQHTFQTRLQDRFGDNGMIGVMIAETKPTATGDRHLADELPRAGTQGRMVNAQGIGG